MSWELGVGRGGYRRRDLFHSTHLIKDVVILHKDHVQGFILVKGYLKTPFDRA